MGLFIRERENAIHVHLRQEDGTEVAVINDVFEAVREVKVVLYEDQCYIFRHSQINGGNLHMFFVLTKHMEIIA